DGEDTPPEIERITKRVPGYTETWEPEFGDEGDLTRLTMTRSTGDVLEETFGDQAHPVTNHIPLKLTRVLNGQTILDLVKTLDTHADSRRVASLASGSEEWVAAYDSLGNLINLGSNTAFEVEQTFAFSPARRLEQVHVQAPGRANQAFFAFDSEARMSSASNSGVLSECPERVEGLI
ncbi:MAG: hypothetical protein KDC71_22550, partial [Acidobacteria bacterium]|nr:hypothetical protein [Acidobacteriota bacterium]